MQWIRARTILSLVRPTLKPVLICSFNWGSVRLAALTVVRQPLEDKAGTFEAVLPGAGVFPLGFSDRG